MPIRDAEVDYIDKKSKTIHLKDGRSEPLSDDAAYSLFESGEARNIRQGTKQATEDFAKAQGEGTFSFLRNLGDNAASKFLTQYVADPLIAGGRAITPGEGQEDMGFLSRVYENLEAKNRGEREARQPIHERNPKSSLAGSAGALGIDVALPTPKFLKNPVAGGVAYGALAGEKPAYEDPLGTAKNAAIGGGIGYGAGRLQNVATQRQALRSHSENAARIGETNQKAQQAFVRNVDQKLAGLEKNLPKAGVGKTSLNIPGFVNAEIHVSPIAGSSEANGLIKFFESVEKGLPANVKEADIRKLYNIVETKMANATANEVPLLNRFREHLVEVLPLRIGQGVAKERFVPKLISQAQRSMGKTIDVFLADAPVIKELSRKSANTISLKGFKERVFANVEKGLNELPAEVFADAYQNGTLNQVVSQLVTKSPAYQQLTQDLRGIMKNLSAYGRAALNTPQGKMYAKANGYLQKIQDDALTGVNQFMSSNGAADFTMKMNEAAEKAASKISNAVGVKNPFISKNILPTNIRPVAQVVPQAPEVGSMARAFETPNFYSNAASKFGGVKGGIGGLIASQVLGLGNAAAGAAGVAGLTALARGATSPGLIGGISRQVGQRGGIEGIIYSISEKPSYTRGVLLDPQDRRDAVAQVENDPDLNNGDKAVLQARINRGISLEKLLEKYRTE